MLLSGRYHSTITSRHRSAFLFFIFLISLFANCTSDATDNSVLIGKWNVYTATRNGRTTETLKDAYFHFVNDTLLLSNILREEKAFTYSFTGDKIKVNGPLKTTYTLSQLSADSLNFYGEIKGYNFGFFTIKDTIAPNLLKTVDNQ